jgi:hypothetical protein
VLDLQDYRSRQEKRRIRRVVLKKVDRAL